MTSLFLPLSRGGAITIADGETAEARLRGILLRHRRLDAIKLTPAHVGLLGALEVTRPGLRVAIVGGEQITAAHVAALRRVSPGIAIVNEYGPTETTVGATFGLLDDAEIHMAGLIRTRVSTCWMRGCRRAGSAWWESCISRERGLRVATGGVAG